ncbi:MAG: anion permease [Gammaproteobacteria bacterium]|nr:anion permease [Gammaproteobacteria bacterium]
MFYFLSALNFSEHQARLIGIIAFLVTLWTNKGLPLGVVSLLPIILFPLLGILDANAVTANYSKTTIFLFIGGFLLAIATPPNAIAMSTSRVETSQMIQRGFFLNILGILFTYFMAMYYWSWFLK